MIDHQEMIANIVEIVEIATQGRCARRGDGVHFFIEHAVPKGLEGVDVGVAAGEPDLEPPSMILINAISTGGIAIRRA
jgi:hypothetical protein